MKHALRKYISENGLTDLVKQERQQYRRKQGTLFIEWIGGRRVYLLLTSLICPVTTHPFLDGAPFLLLIETLTLFPNVDMKLFASLMPVMFRCQRPLSICWDNGLFRPSF